MQGDACRAEVGSALALGYRHIDAAEMYANEEAIGAIASSGVARKARCAESRIRRRLPQAIAHLPKDKRFVRPGFGPAWD